MTNVVQRAVTGSAKKVRATYVDTVEKVVRTAHPRRATFQKPQGVHIAQADSLGIPGFTENTTK